MSEKIAQFRLVDFLISKASIELKDLSQNAELKIEFTPNIEDYHENENKLKYSLEVNILNHDKSVKYINILCTGFFEFDAGLNQENKEIFKNINAPAILYPYIRSYISALTGLSGIKPVILPTINIAAALSHIK
jgi:preprotein translocase subunit SecB